MTELETAMTIDDVDRYHAAWVAYHNKRKPK